MSVQLKLSSAIVFFCMALASAASFGETPVVDEQKEPVKKEVKDEVGPHKVVEDVTFELMSVVSKNKASLKADPKPFYTEVRAIMEKAVDFKYIARNVMGVKNWKSSTAEQKKQFVEVFTSGLVETYAKGMANFADFEITVQAPISDIGEKRKVEVVQKFKGPSGINHVSYTMGKSKTEGWKLINVVLDGVNLGKTLRAQFSQSVTDNGGDLDAAIAGWTWKG